MRQRTTLATAGSAATAREVFLAWDVIRERRVESYRSLGGGSRAAATPPVYLPKLNVQNRKSGHSASYRLVNRVTRAASAPGG